MKYTPFILLLLPLAQAQPPAPKSTQNPSPMVEYTRTHPRLKEERSPGRRVPLTLGNLFLPDKLKEEKPPLFLCFHCGTWIPEVAAAKNAAAVVLIQLGSGSAAYGKPFNDAKTFTNLLQEATTKAGREFSGINLVGWSAGYGSIRAILKVPEHYQKVQGVLLLDGLHCGYVGGKPGPKDSQLITEDLESFVQFARDAAAGKKRFLLTHTEIFPGTFASTTETADHLLMQLHLKRKPVLRWGPLGTQILCEVKQGSFHLLGFAGNSAPDHVDLLHALPELMASW